jgi:hypothetical protein
MFSGSKGLTADEIAGKLGLKGGPEFRGTKDFLDLLVSLECLDRAGGSKRCLSGFHVPDKTAGTVATEAACPAVVLSAFQVLPILSCWVFSKRNSVSCCPEA